MAVGAVHSYAWLALQIRQWWIPYLFGPAALHRGFGWCVTHGYDRTIKILPSIDESRDPRRPITATVAVLRRLVDAEAAELGIAERESELSESSPSCSTNGPSGECRRNAGEV